MLFSESHSQQNFLQFSDKSQTDKKINLMKRSEEIITVTSSTELISISTVMFLGENPNVTNEVDFYFELKLRQEKQTREDFRKEYKYQVSRKSLKIYYTEFHKPRKCEKPIYQIQPARIILKKTNSKVQTKDSKSLSSKLLKNVNSGIESNTEKII